MQQEHYLNFTGSSPHGGIIPYLWATAGVGLAVAGAFGLHTLVPHANLSLVFLTGVLVVAARWGLGPSLFAGALSFLAFNFFFTPPYHTLYVHADADVATLIFFLAVAGLTGQLAARMHNEVAKNQAGLQRLTNLYNFSKRMAAAANTDDVLRELAQHLSTLLRGPVAVLLPQGEDALQVRAHHPAHNPLEVNLAHAEAAWRAHTSPAPRGDFSFLTLGTSRGPVGLVAIQSKTLPEELWEQARSLCDQAAIAVERTTLVADLEAARLMGETEQLRSALLSSVSHDLRTPLSSIIGSTTSLLEYGDNIAETDRRELLRMVLNEAERLNRYIQNLLDMTRLGQGGLSLRRDWVGLEDIVASALERMASALSDFTVKVDIASTVPLLHVHGAFIEQALINILDNAARFSPPGGLILIEGRLEEERVIIDVTDQGPGIPEEEREKVFDMFYSITGGDRHRQGSGLGLAICRGLVGAHGGEANAFEGEGGVGTRMRIALPLALRETEG